MNSFNPPSNSYTNPPNDLMDCFYDEKETVEELLKRAPLEEPGKTMIESQRYLLGSLKNESRLIGFYSKNHVSPNIAFLLV